MADLGNVRQGLEAFFTNTPVTQIRDRDRTSAKNRLDEMLALDEQRQAAMFIDARGVNTALIGGNVELARRLLNNRLDNLGQLEGNPSETQSILDRINSGDIEGTIKELNDFDRVGVSLKLVDDPIDREIKEAKLKSSLDPTLSDRRTATQKDFSTFQDLITKANETGEEKDRIKAERFGRAAKFIKPTEQEASDIKVTETERKAIAKATVARRQGFIDSGIEAADAFANVSRAVSLLDEVGTGGFDNLANKAKKFFGVEAADEGELSNLMGKAVLAQLKPLFGAAFTKSEGDKLDKLEASFGKSPAANKRILNNVMKIINRAARRGLAAAEEQGDDFTANEIREAMAFKLEEKSIKFPLPISKSGNQQPVASVNVGRFKVEAVE